MSPFNTAREIPASPAQVFAAFADPQRLARWWGPAGFSSTFDVCEFKPGGRWTFTLHGPDGKNYPNQSLFAEIEPARKVVIQHVSGPQYVLTITLAPTGAGTLVTWSQAFAHPDVARRIAPIVVPANEQNLDRLAAEVRREISAAPGAA